MRHLLKKSNRARRKQKKAAESETPPTPEQIKKLAAEAEQADYELTLAIAIRLNRRKWEAAEAKQEEGLRRLKEAEGKVGIAHKIAKESAELLIEEAEKAMAALLNRAQAFYDRRQTLIEEELHKEIENQRQVQD